MEESTNHSTITARATRHLRYGILGLLFSGLVVGCHKESLPDPATVLHTNEDMLTQVIIYDVFTPPVASRIYAYSSLAAYEAIRFDKKNALSITAQLHGFGAMPVPEKEKEYNFALAATKAFFTVVRNVKVFSVDSLKSYEAATYDAYRDNLDQTVYDRSLAFGEAIAARVLARAKTDGYLASRGKPKHLGSEEPGKWRPTPPDYLDGVEWCWNTMKPLVMDSASQFMAPPPPAYSTDTASAFYKAMKEVYDTSRALTPGQQAIARYWDDNPFVIEHSGHMMLGNKKITPGGHWMGIAAIAAKMVKADEVKTAATYALTAVALYDAFISCWDVKYKTNYIRPVTVINQQLDNGWTPFLQTPPFPEYTSGHSTITRAAATVLSALYGDHFAFQDTSDLHYIGMERQFSSFVAAADEASISRFYGGIHYKLSVNEGARAGRNVGLLVAEKVKYTR